MASMQCYRSCNETYETEHHENSSLTHKVSDMVGKVFHGNNHNHNHNPNHNHSQSLCHQGQTLPAHHHNHTQSLYYHGQTALQAHPHSNHQLGQYGAGGMTPTLGTGGHGQHGNHGHSNDCSTEYGNGTYEIRKVKNRSHSRLNNPNKHRDGNRSCSDSSGSDSD